MTDRLRLDQAQFEAYFDRIALPEHDRVFPVNGLSEEKQLAHLNVLLKHHIVAIPFENLTLHYSWHRVIDVSPRHLLRKIVIEGQHGRGGYCMEVNTLFHTLLLSLGFDVFMAGARVYNHQRQAYGGFSHCVNIVTIGATQYMVDVGFGANGPTSAMPLHPGSEHIQCGAASARIMREAILQNTNRACEVWIYQHKINDQSEWLPAYCFVDFEFILEDIYGMNLSPWKSPSSFFPQRVLVTRFTTECESIQTSPSNESTGYRVQRGQIDGSLVLDHNKLRWRRRGEIVLEKSLDTEADRISALGQYFGIVLDVQDREAIRGTVGEIGSR